MSGDFQGETVGIMAVPGVMRVVQPAQGVTKLEEAVASAYVTNAHLAKDIHRLMRAQSWPALFAEYGHIVKALMAYVHKVERAYAAKRTLYRGMRLAEYHLTENYVVGRVVTWHAFSNVTTDLATALLNVTTDRQLAQSCAQHDRGLFGSVGSDGVEVLFVIQTSSGRGATLPGNYSELLLAPFTYFEVLSVERQRTWVITMQVVKLQRSWVETSPHRLVLLHPGSMPWPWSAIPKEVLSELDDDAEEAVRRKLDPPGALLLASFVAIINALLVGLYFAGFDVDDFTIVYSQS
ncbi:unnamed protein product [Symbiodinium natans]|uniref:Mono(ADP-ribosyl)transferase n=1 Tax=Symbiodinium natans TaxID=878477 RepID=A0A812TKA2_9DINO|nr:unnamed protein product [Symbiodinium natans]